MKELLSFIRKEFLHIRRDVWTMMMMIVLPIVMMVLFSYAITTEIKNSNFGVLNLSKDITTNTLIERIAQSEYFTLTKNYKSYSEIEESLLNKEVDIAIVFQENFSQRLYANNDASLQIIADGSEPNSARTLMQYLSNIVEGFNSELLTLSLSNNPSNQVNIIVPELKLLYNPLMKSSYNFVPGVMGFIIILVCSMMASISIVREKERGTMELLLASPIRPINIIIAKLMPYFVVSIITLIIIILIAHYIMGVPVLGSLWWIGVLSIVYIIVSLSLGLLISSVSQTQLAALLFSGLVLLMPTMLLSGMMFSIENMPQFLQIVAQLMPATWFISAIRKLMIMGVEYIYIIRELVVLSIMAFVFIFISLKMFKKRLE